MNIEPLNIHCDIFVYSGVKYITMLLIFIIPIIIFILVFVVAYYLSGFVYKAMEKSDPQKARKLQVIIAMILVTVLESLALFFYLSNLSFDR